jgi:hypothetical protein
MERAVARPARYAHAETESAAVIDLKFCLQTVILHQLLVIPEPYLVVRRSSVGKHDGPVYLELRRLDRGSVGFQDKLRRIMAV